MANDTGGVWRTVGGRRIFIKTGQSLSSAMKESGKFKKGTKIKVEGYSHPIEADYEDRLAKYKEIQKDANKRYDKGEIDKEERDKLVNEAHDKYIKQKDTTPKEANTKAGKNDTETLKKIADSNEDISGRKDLDDIEKDYIKNRREEISRNQRIKEFTDNANKTHEKTKAKALERENDNLAKAQKEYDENPSDFKEIAKDYGLKGDDYKKYEEYAKSKNPLTSESYNKGLDEQYKKLKSGKIDYAEYKKTTDDLMDRYYEAQKNIPRNLRVGPGDLTDNDKDVLNAAFKEFSGTKAGSNDWVRNAFEQYKKDHPGSKLTLADFKKTAKK